MDFKKIKQLVRMEKLPQLFSIKGDDNQRQKTYGVKSFDMWETLKKREKLKQNITSTWHMYVSCPSPVCFTRLDIQGFSS